MKEPEKSKEEFDKQQEFDRQMEFARGKIITVSDPNNNLTMETKAFSRYTKEQIMGFLQNPYGNAKQIRDASIYMADVSMQYDRLLTHFATMYTWQYTVSPVNYRGEETTKGRKTMEKSYFETLAFLEQLDLEHIAPNVVKAALREGAFFGVVWTGYNAIYIQQIPADYCKITNIVDGTWQYCVDMTRIQERKLQFYPPEFTVMYNNYKETGLRWQEVPIKISFCLKADETTLAYNLPPFAATLGILYDIEQYKALQKTGAEIDNYKLINMQIPLNEDGTPQVDWKLADQYYQQLCNAVAQYIGVSISPMKLQDFTFEKSGAADQVDIVSRAEDNYWASNGSAALLHGSISGKTAGTLKMSVKSDEAFMRPMVEQVETLVNRLLRDLGSAVQKYKINILPVTIYNYDDMLKVYREGATLGIPGSKSAYAALLNTPAHDVLGMNMVEEKFLKMNDLTPLKSTYTTSASDNGAGRPKSKEEDLSESGEETQAVDSNANR